MAVIVEEEEIVILPPLQQRICVVPYPLSQAKVTSSTVALIKLPVPLVPCPEKFEGPNVAVFAQAGLRNAPHDEQGEGQEFVKQVVFHCV